MRYFAFAVSFAVAFAGQAYFFYSVGWYDGSTATFDLVRTWGVSSDVIEIPPGAKCLQLNIRRDGGGSGRTNDWDPLVLDKR